MNKEIRLFVDAHTFDGEFQGSRTYIKELYNNFPYHKNIQLYFAAHDIVNLEKEIVKRDNVHFVEYKSVSRIKRLCIELPRLLKELKIDYAHFQYIAPPIKVCKYIITTHDIIFHDFPKEFSLFYRLNKHILYKYSALKADILTTVSEFSKNSINKYFNIPPNNIHVIHNAVNNKYFLEYNTDEQKAIIAQKYKLTNFVLFVSRIEPRKNHVAIVNAFKKLDLFKKGYQLVFIGTESIVDEKLNKALMSLTADERKQYFHLNNIPEDDLIAFYKSAAVCIYPSKGEGFGIPPLESGALKAPTLCSNVSAMSDFAFFGDALFNPSDQAAIENKLSEMLFNGTEPARLQKIHDAIKNQYSWERSSEKLFKLVTSQKI